MCGDNRHSISHPHSNRTTETYAKALSPKVTPDSAIVTGRRALMEHYTNLPVKPRPQHHMTNRNANVTPLPEAHGSQKNRPRLRIRGGRQHVPHTRPIHPNETHAQAAGLMIAPNPAITTQLQQRTSHPDTKEYSTNHAEKGMYTQRTSRHKCAQCETTL